MSSSFGTVLKLQLFGESHGPAVGMCLDLFFFCEIRVFRVIRA